MSDKDGFGFEILHQDPNSNARVGRLTTPHGEIETPNFIFCATKGEIITTSMDEVREEGAQIILSNTYHHMVLDTVDEVAAAGGLQHWNMQGRDKNSVSYRADSAPWRGPMLTDSGGYQIFAMGHGSVSEDAGSREGKGSRILEKGEVSRSGQGNVKTLISIDEKEGAIFKSYRREDYDEEGNCTRLITVSPEESMRVQRLLGADLIVAFDELTAMHHDEKYTADSMRMSIRWGERSLKAFNELAGPNEQRMYGVVQGGIYPDLRRESMEYVANNSGYFGVAVGGALGWLPEDGSPPLEMYRTVQHVMQYTDPNKPVHLLGIGKNPTDIFVHLRAGIDTFDCVHPTRIARHATAIVKGEPKGKVDISKSGSTNNPNPLDKDCNCYACDQGMSRGYLQEVYKKHKKLKPKEKNNLPLDEHAERLLTRHNMATMTRLMSEIREAIKAGTLSELEKEWIPTPELRSSSILPEVWSRIVKDDKDIPLMRL